MDKKIEEIRMNLPPLEQIAKPKHSSRHGNEIQGAHPIHGGTTKSDKDSQNFTINTTKQVWHCFAHDTGGDIFNWIAVQEGIIDCKDISSDTVREKFPEILEVAADKAGVELDITEEEKEEYQKKRKEKQRLYEAHEVAQEYFRDNLNERVKEWVKENYGFSEKEIEEFGIGYAPPNEDGLRNRLKENLGVDSFSCGLLLKYDNRYVDFFQGRVTFPYYNGGNIVYYIGRKTPWTPDDKDWQKGKYLKQMVGKNKDYINNHVTNHLYGLDTIKGKSKVLITEGITDAISAITMGYPTISPVTVKFKDDDIQKIKKHVRNKEVYVCNDADEAGIEGALDTIEKIENSHLVELNEGDLNDYFMNNSTDDFQNLIENALPRHEALAKYREENEYLFVASLIENEAEPDRVRKVWDNQQQTYVFSSIWDIMEGAEELKNQLARFRRSEQSDFRSPTAIEVSLKKRIIAGVILRDMKQKGKFLYEQDSQQVYYFNRNNHEVFNLGDPNRKEDSLGDPKAKGFFQQHYGLSAATEEGNYVGEHLKTYGKRNGQEVKVRRYFYYNKDENILYIHNKNSEIFVLDGEEIKTELNGETVYFETLHENKIEYIEKDEREYPDEVIGQIDEWKDEGSFLHQVMANRTNFAPKTALSARQQRLQYLITLYMFPFKTWFSTKPILAFIGEKGSGKTLTMRALGRLLTNPDYELTKIPDEDDFYVAAHNNPLYFLDQADEPSPWLCDALAAIATGVSIKQRKLYTNFQQADVKLDCFIGINSRTPPFKRDDVVDRLLILYVERINSNIDPGLILKPIQEYWNVLWSEYLDDLNDIVKTMSEMDLSKIKSDHRLVEWVVFAKVVGNALGINNEKLDELIDNMKYEKAAFTLQDDSILPAMRDFTSSDLNEGKWYSAKELHKMLSEVNDIYRENYHSFQSLAKRLPNIHPELNNLFGLKQRYNKSKNRHEYRVGKSLGDKNDKKESDDASQQKLEDSKSFECTYYMCDKVFSTKEELNKHLDEEH